MQNRLLKLFFLCCGLASCIYILLLLTRDHVTVSRPRQSLSSLTSRLTRGTVDPAFLAEMDRVQREAASQAEARAAKEKSPSPKSGTDGPKNSAEEKKQLQEALNVTRARPVSNETSLSASRGRKGSKKYVIFVCNERRSCGGWGDRQRGLVGVYALAIVTGRQFGIIMTVPCNITNVYLPNRVNWVIPDHELQGKSSISIMDMGSKARITGRLGTMDFNAEYPQDVVYIRTNGEYWLGIRRHILYRARLPAWARGSRAEFFAHGWRELMKPAESLGKRLQDFLHRIDFDHRPRPLACAHVRVGRSETIKTDTVVRCNISDLPVLWNFLDQWVKNGSHVFLATDNMQVRNLTRARFGDMMYDSGGMIVHVDQGRHLPNACQGFESALLDQLILTQCDVLVTSHSIFSQRAAYLRGKLDNLFSFLNGKMNKWAKGRM